MASMRGATPRSFTAVCVHIIHLFFENNLSFFIVDEVTSIRPFHDDTKLDLKKIYFVCVVIILPSMFVCCLFVFLALQHIVVVFSQPSSRL
jgi:hypothetical protein